MTHFLVTEDKPDGHRLEDILNAVRGDIIKRATKIADDRRPEAAHVLKNNVRILELLTEAIQLADDSTATLTRAFGPNLKGGPPRIGKP
ncbi:MAG: histidine kinase [Alphaproteobacteria bacterium]|nr:histidine kinase [Alphaproteobacteria bacterium]